MKIRCLVCLIVTNANIQHDLEQNLLRYTQKRYYWKRGTPHYDYRTVHKPKLKDTRVIFNNMRMIYITDI